jgi:hypothetical protein
VSSLEKRVAVLEAERRVVKEMHPAIREALERVKAGIPDREEHMRRLEVNRGR